MPVLGPRTTKVLGEVIQDYQKRTRSRRTARRGLATVPVALPVIGVTDAAIDKSNSGTVSVWYGEGGSESDSGQNITAWNLFADIGSGKIVACIHNGFAWYIIAAECE